MYSRKVFFAAILIVILTSLTAFLTLYNNFDPNFIIYVSILSTLILTIYMCHILTRKPRITPYHYAFIGISVFFSLTFLDYGLNGAPTYLGGLSLYTLKVLNTIFLFFAVVLGVIVNGIELEYNEKEMESKELSKK